MSFQRILFMFSAFDALGNGQSTLSLSSNDPTLVGYMAWVV